jgi:hypothetical protein
VVEKVDEIVFFLNLKKKIFSDCFDVLIIKIIFKK